MGPENRRTEEKRNMPPKDEVHQSTLLTDSSSDKAESGRQASFQSISNEDIHEQRMWNLQQIVGTSIKPQDGPFKFNAITIGYVGKSFQQFVDLLIASDVKLLVDIRNTPGSRYERKYNKGYLMDNLFSFGIEYLHIPELGVPEDLRKKLSSGQMTHSEYFRLYDSMILTNDRIQQIATLIDRYGVIALLCAEPSPKKCHRHRIAAALRKLGFLVFDL